MDFRDLLDLCLDNTTITLFDIDLGINFAEDLSLEEARDWYNEQNDFEFSSIDIQKVENIVCNFERKA